MDTDTDMVRILKRVSMVLGIVVVIGSIQFSYDGFDQNVNGMNPDYTTFALIIGYTLAIVFNLIEFIFGTNYKDLNWTLRGIGVFAYVYSIYTNYLGIKHLLGASEFMAWSLAMIMDVFPEPAIAWAMGDSLMGDLLGNLGKIVFGEKNNEKNRPVQSQSLRPQAQKSQYVAQHKPVYQSQPQSQREEPTYHPEPRQAQQVGFPKKGERVFKQGEFHPLNYEE